MPNEQTSVPLFVANTVLTASQQNLSAGTGVPVFATTITRDAAFGGSNKALAEGQLCYLSSTNVVQYYDGAAWATVGPAAAPSSGLVFISSTSSLSTSFSMNNVFSSTYDNYRIILSFTGSDANMTMRLRVGGADNSTSNYDRQILIGSGASASAARTLAGTGWTDFLVSDGAAYWVLDIFNPFASLRTGASINNGYTAASDLSLRLGALQQRQTTSFDGFTISAGVTMTGTCTVFGYSKS
jgi:hypothetical protein